MTSEAGLFMKTLIFCALLASCSKAGDSSKQMPKLPPPPNAQPTVSIAVDIDGKAAPPVDLRASKPDFEDGEHRAWRMTTLFGPATKTVAVTGENDVTVQFQRASDARDPQPALMLTRRGDIVALLVDPADPFPSYHGQGRRLGRPGDPMPRIAGVKKIRVYSDTIEKPASK
jgi:hypothetical protein